jgi:hypothetical protein
MKKRGFFFTLLVFIFFFLVLTSVMTFIKTQEMKEKTAVEKIRINSLESLSDAIKFGADRVAYLSGYNAISSAATYVATNANKAFLNNSRCRWNSCIFELMFNASIEGRSGYQDFNLVTVNFTYSDQMGNTTLKYWFDQLNATATRANIRMNFSVSDYAVYQVDPWNVGISYIIYVYMNDISKESIARFETIPVNIVIPIEGFEEPNYSLNTTAAVRRYVKKSPYSSYRLTSLIGTSQNGSTSNWSYIRVNKAPSATPTCAEIGNMDRGTILLVMDSSNITNRTFFCPAINSFQGFIFQDDYCGRNDTCKASVLPNAYNFTTQIYNLIPNGTYVLLDGENRRIWDITNLSEAYSAGYFFEANFAPSYLMRLSGQFTPSIYGIESFVKINQFTAPRSAVDYYYFNKTANPAAYKIKGTPNCENATICNNLTIPHFLLDNELAELSANPGNYSHMKLYGVGRIVVGYTPPIECGDVVCDPIETCSTCPQDCGVCSTCSVQTLYMRSDTDTINGLTAYKLNATQSTSLASAIIYSYEGGSVYITQNFGIRVWKNSSAGVATEITSGTPVAIASGSTSDLKSATWTAASPTTLSPTDAIVVRVYADNYNPPATLQATFITEPLGARTLNATTWNVSYYLYRVYYPLPYKETDYYFYFGISPYNSNIVNFTYYYS